MTTPIIGNVSFYALNFYFFIFSFFGWIAEVVYSALKKGKFVNRGFLNGTVCPIYGVAMAFLVLFLNPLAKKWWVLFFVGVAFSTLLEFLTGFVLDKIFKTKWWDYSKEPFNIKGYVCLRFSLLWGFVVVLLFGTLVPLVNKLIDIVPYHWLGFIIFSVLWAILIADLVVTIKQLINLKRNYNEVSKFAIVLQDNSNKIGEKIFDATIKVEEKISVLSNKIKRSRFIKAFPKLDFLDKVVKPKNRKKKNK